MSVGVDVRDSVCPYVDASSPTSRWPIFIKLVESTYTTYWLLFNMNLQAPTPPNGGTVDKTKKQKFGTFHISKFLEETEAASALKFCIGILEAICYKCLGACPH